MNETLESSISALNRWFIGQCNRDWEHDYGIRLSLNNSGIWALSVGLDNTSAEDVLNTELPYTEILQNGGVWLKSSVKDKMYQGESNLFGISDLIRNFLSTVNYPEISQVSSELDTELRALCYWFTANGSHFSGVDSRIQIRGMSDPGWSLEIDLTSTRLDKSIFFVDCNLPFRWSQTDIPWAPEDIDWNEYNIPWSQKEDFYLRVRLRGHKYQASGDQSQLANLMRIFLSYSSHQDLPADVNQNITS